MLLIQMPFILPLNYTKCSVGRADVQQLQKNNLSEKEKKSGDGAGRFRCQVTLVWDNRLHFVSTDRGSQLVPCSGLLPGHHPSTHQSPTSKGPEEQRGTMTGRKLTEDTKEGIPGLESWKGLSEESLSLRVQI